MTKMRRSIARVFHTRQDAGSGRVLNRRLLFVTLAAAAIVLPSLYVWHRYQVRRNAFALLQRAGELEREENWRAAADYVYRYLSLVPDDPAARAQLARTYGKSAKTEAERRRAIELYYAAAGANEGSVRLECNRSVMTLLLEMERHEEAVQQAELVLAGAPDDLAALRVRALALFAGYREGTLSAAHGNRALLYEHVHSAWERQQQDLELAGAMAIVYREQPELLPPDVGREQAKRERTADGVMDLLIVSAGDNPRAYISRHLYRRKYSLSGAESDLIKAVELGPLDTAVQTLAARYWTDSAKRLLDQEKSPETDGAIAAALDRAATIYRHMIAELDAVAELAYVGLGDVQTLQGDATEAMKTWERGLGVLRGESLALSLRLTEAFTDTNQIDQALRQIQVVQSHSERRVSPDAIEDETVRRLIQLLHAQLLVMQGDLGGAERLLDKAALSGQLNASVTGRAQRAWFALGEARGRIGAWDQAAKAFEEATRLQPRRAGSQFGAAVAWHQAHRLDLAIPYYQQVVRQVNSCGLWLALAQARLEQNMALPESQCDWESVRDALAKARSSSETATGDQPDPTWRIRLMEADTVAAGGDDPNASEADRRRRAGEMLGPLEQSEQTNPDCLAELATHFARWGEHSAADRVAGQLKAIVNGDYRWVVVRADLDASQGRCSQARALLQQQLEIASIDVEKAKLLRMLVGVSLLDHDLGAVRSALEALHRLETWNLQNTMQLAELTIQLGDFEEVERLSKELEGAGSSGRTFGMYCHCLSLLTQSNGAHDPRVVQARNLQESLVRERPWWSAPHALKGRLDETQGLLTQAAEAYGTALSLGERRPWVLERQVMLLNQLRRFDEAEPLLRRLQSGGALQGQLFLPPSDGGASELAPLLAMAQRAVERNPRDLHARVWYGHLLLRQAQQADVPRVQAMAAAKSQFDEALAIAPREPSAWNGLFTYYVQNQQFPHARRVLELLVTKCSFDGTQRAFVLGQGYEALGDLAAAEREYQRAAQLAPANTLVRLHLAGVYWKTNPAKAERLLRDSLRTEPNSLEIRRALAGFLSVHGGASGQREALALLDRGARPDQVASGDLRLRSKLLLQKTTDVMAARREARALLETLVSRRGEATADDFFLLGQVCEGVLDFDVAQRQFVAAALTENCPADHLAACAEKLLRFDDADAVGEAVARLEQREPGTTRTIGLRAQWLNAADRLEEAEAELQSWADQAWDECKDSRQQIEHCAAAGRIFETIGLYSQAEVWRRRGLGLDPTAYTPLALNLAVQGGDKSAEAVKLCLAAAVADATPRTAIALASVVIAAGLAAQDDATISNAFQAASARHGDNADLLIALANVDVVRGDVDAAVTKYERLRRLRPQDAEILNNLASLLADYPERHLEALELVRQARDRSGDNAQLLDTEAQILLSQGNADAAISRLEQAAGADPLDPRLQIHLAASYHSASLTDKARSALDRVSEATLDAKYLTKKDRELLSTLTLALGASQQ